MDGTNAMQRQRQRTADAHIVCMFHCTARRRFHNNLFGSDFCICFHSADQFHIMRGVQDNAAQM